MEPEATRRASLARLPREVQSRVLSLVNNYSGNEAVLCMLVCKQWSFLVPPLISKATLTLRSRSLVQFVQMTKYENLQWLKLDRCSAVKNESTWLSIFESLGKNFKQLKTLHLVKVLPALVAADFCALFHHCTVLRDLLVDNCIIDELTLPLDEATSLHSLDIRHCRRLSLPSLAHATALQTLAISNCSTIYSLPSIDALSDLRSLEMPSCVPIEHLPSLSNLPKLQHVSLRGSCGNRPDVAEMAQLKSLDLYAYHSVDPVPCLTGLSNLESLAVWFYRREASSQQLAHLTQLKHLHLHDEAAVFRHDLPFSLEDLSLELPSTTEAGYSRLSKVLGGLSALTSLEILDLQQSVVLSVSNLTNLRRLVIRQCDRLDITVLTPLEALTALRELTLMNCDHQYELTTPSTLIKLRVSEFHQLTLKTPLDLLTSLQELRVESCGGFATLPGLERLSGLITLHVINCDVEVLPSLSGLVKLRELRLVKLLELERLPVLAHLSCLEDLDLDAGSEQELPGLFDLPALKRLRIVGPNLVDLPPLSSFSALQVLKLENLNKVQALPSVEGLLALSELHLSSYSIWALPYLSALSSLRTLNLVDCRTIQLLPELEGLTRLLELKLIRCPKLRALPPYKDVGLSPDLEILYNNA